jgi:serine/threonine-protein kinase
VSDYLHDRVIAAVGDQYLIEGEIGRGGMAAVFRALDLRLHRHVAIKVLPPELAFNGDVRTRFLREAQTAAQLGHPHIVQIFSVDERSGIVYFVMALVEGESLAARLAREPKLSIDQTKQILRDVADALDYAHRRGVVHRDIKPDNILIDRATGRAVVTDFGIARAAALDARLTVTGVAVGTPAYMSPEQALGEREVDGRSDQYSLGVVGYQMLTGQTPFRASNTPAMLVKHVSEAPRPLRDIRPDIPAPLASAIDRTLCKRPEERWEDAGVFRDALGSDVVLWQPMDGQRGTLSRDLREYPLAPHGVADGRGNRGALVGPPAAVPPAAPGAAPRWPAGPNPHDDVLPALPQLLPPTGMGRREWKTWAREQRRIAKEAAKVAKAQRQSARHRNSDAPTAAEVEDRVVRFRRSIVRTSIAIPTLFAINVAMQGDPWFFIPSAVLLVDVLARAGSLWADGVSPFGALRRGWRDRIRGSQDLRPVPPAARAPELPPMDPAASLVPADVLAGPHGSMVRRAAADRAQIREILAKLNPIEKELLPDVTPTVDGLVERVAAISITVHRLDNDVSGSSLGALDERIVALEKETSTPDRLRRLALLQRQRSTLHDLLERRRTLLNQLESASLALQNLKFDLLKLRSAGVSSALEDVTSATREARALSRDIGHILEASDDLRKI